MSTTAEEESDQSSGSVDETTCGDDVCSPGEICPQDCDTNVCGDAEVAGDEECDDGNVVDGDGCEGDCSLTPEAPCGDSVCGVGEDGDSCYVDCGACGNGVKEGPEGCDAGAMNADDGACRPGCVVAVCGDGVVRQGVEDCDDGNNADDDGCESDCTCECGDGVVCPSLSQIEECDDGEFNDNGAGCKADCSKNRCGDGFVWEGVEECDEVNGSDTDDCSLDCYAPRVVFLTSDWFDTGDLGGIAGADQRCNERAAAGLPGVQGRKFRAWISGADKYSAPYYRIRDPEFSGWYKLVDKSLVGRGWAGLIDGDSDEVLDHAIVMSESGTKANSASVWTNTDRYGKQATTILHCDDWTSSDADEDGYIGIASASICSTEWTISQPSTCGGGSRLYCFEVAE